MEERVELGEWRFREDRRHVRPGGQRVGQVAAREARESVYWLRICRALSLGDTKELELLIVEGDQLARILAAIIISKKRRLKMGLAVFLFCILNFAF